MVKLYFFYGFTLTSQTISMPLYYSLRLIFKFNFIQISGKFMEIISKILFLLNFVPLKITCEVVKYKELLFWTIQCPSKMRT